MRHTKTIAFTTVLACLVILFSRCFNNGAVVAKDPRGEQYAGTQACIGCHRNIHEAYTHNSHFKTSAIANHDSLAGRVAHNVQPFHFSDSAYVEIKKGQNDFIQSYVVNNKEVVSARFDIAFGSGEKAQTYAYWKDDKLYQLPLTYFDSMKTWANSPGFPASRARFDRVIDSRCFECHASYVNKETVQAGALSVSEKLDRNTIIYGIDCERCHGPAMNHVKYQQENPSEKKSMYIASIKSLGRQQQLDVCGICHSGNDQSSQFSLFAFVPGDTLSHYYYPDFGYGKKEIDVHGKQMQMLQMSKCFIQSQMTCNTCHDAHLQSNNTGAFIAKCVSCHQNSMHVKMSLEAPKVVKANSTFKYPDCLDCHMPLEESKVISFGMGATQKQIPYYLRSHKIAVY